MIFNHRQFVTRREVLQVSFWAFLVLGIPFGLAVYVLGLSDWDLSIPLLYNTGDAVWQFTLTKFLKDTGWVLTNPYLGAPDIAHWYNNAAAQTSVIHSTLMLGIVPFVDDAVKLQQIYYLLNFPLICLTSYVACRLLGASRIVAYCVGLLFAFTTFRIGAMHYAFLSNYFMVPLAVVPVVWLLSGRFAASFQKPLPSESSWHDLRQILKSRDFLLGLIFVALIAASDGYYAFFTLLLLGFASLSRILIGDWRRPLSLVPAGMYISTLMTVSLALTAPLHLYKQVHRSEFYPNGVQDPALIKHRFEAEVYSSSLKLLIAPIPQHHIKPLGVLGQRIVDTSEAARQFKNGPPIVPLGTLATLLFATALVLLGIPTLRRHWRNPGTLGNSTLEDRHASEQSMVDVLLALTFFIFLCSVSGGIGTLVALVFPTIRAYDRFPLFLIFVLYLGAGLFMTRKLQNAARRTGWTAALLLITGAALYDQIPNDARKGNETTKTVFLAERHFVQKIERTLPPGAMVYQYPYSQYLRESKHYGWGSFAGIRLYLHSHQLRWSNGGAKNSPADDWNFRISQLPLAQLIAEVEAVGFRSFVIDRTVVTGAAYEQVRKVFSARGYEMLEDDPSKLTMIRLRDPGYQLVYDTAYREVERLIIHDANRLVQSDLPEIVDSGALMRLIDMSDGTAEKEIRKADHPEVFFDSQVLSRGSGQMPIVPVYDMQGTLSCRLAPESEELGTSRKVVLTLENRSAFHWKLGDGVAPIRIGVHFRQPDGQILSWDNGFRVPSDAYIRKGTSYTVSISVDSLVLPPELTQKEALVAEFELLQEGVAWFRGISCNVPLP